MRASLCVLLLAAVLAAQASAQRDYFVSDTFENIKNMPGEQIVVFYRSSESNHQETFDVINTAAPQIQKKVSHFGFRKCDGDLPENRAAFEDAQFNTGVFVFTSTPYDGIEKYTMELEPKLLAQHVKNKYLPADESAVKQFTNEDEFWDRFDDAPEGKALPVFVKFYETWCEHCKRMKVMFQRAAKKFEGKVMFMEVECSANDDTIEFCTHQGAKNFPVLMLFDGESKHVYKEDARNIVLFERFLKKKLKASRKAKKASKKTKAKRPPVESEEEEEENEGPALKLGRFAPPEAKGVTSGAGGDCSACDAKVEKLEKRVKALETRIDELVDAMVG